MGRDCTLSWDRGLASAMWLSRRACMTTSIHKEKAYRFPVGIMRSRDVQAARRYRMLQDAKWSFEGALEKIRLTMLHHVNQIDCRPYQKKLIIPPFWPPVHTIKGSHCLGFVRVSNGRGVIQAHLSVYPCRGQVEGGRCWCRLCF